MNQFKIETYRNISKALLSEIFEKSKWNWGKMLIAGTISDLTVKMQLFCYQNCNGHVYIWLNGGKNEHQTNQPTTNSTLQFLFAFIEL